MRCIRKNKICSFLMKYIDKLLQSHLIINRKQFFIVFNESIPIMTYSIWRVKKKHIAFSSPARIQLKVTNIYFRSLKFIAPTKKLFFGHYIFHSITIWHIVVAQLIDSVDPIE